MLLYLNINLLCAFEYSFAFFYFHKHFRFIVFYPIAYFHNLYELNYIFFAGVPLKINVILIPFLQTNALF